MQFFDTHTHLYLDDYDDEGGDVVVGRAIDAGVTRMLFPAVAPDTAQRMFDLAERFPENVYVATGLHPTDIKEDGEESLAHMLSFLDDPSRHIVAIGEIGIDKYWDCTFLDSQMQIFEKQAMLARDKGLPILIHCREGLDEAIEVLQGVKGVKGVFHSFGGSEADIDRIRRNAGDFYFGINGIVTFKNSTLRNVLPHITLERILLETDAPWLAPVPNRGKRNESSYIPLIAEHIASSMGLPLEKVADITTKNALNLLSLG